MEVLGPKGPAPYGGVEENEWALRQLALAAQILDNPGGGLVFASQTVGQVRSALKELDSERWADVIAMLQAAEMDMVWRRFQEARDLVGRAREALSSASH